MITMAHTTTLISQLRTLEQLTRTEAQIARLRVTQARTEAVSRELRQNTENADRRAAAISDALGSLGAVPDVVTPAVGRVLALVKGTLEQAQSIDEALLGDLALEHQLLDRARYLRVVAEHAGERGLARLAERLVEAHTATVDWLTTVLAEEALGGPPALVATPFQKLSGGVTRAVAYPTRLAMSSVNRAVNTVTRTGEHARSTVEDYTERVERFGAGTREVLTAGRDAAMQRAEGVARREGAGDTAGAVHEARRGLGGLTAGELPVEGYDELSAQQAIAAVRELTKPEDVSTVVAYEEAHKDRSGVVSAAQTRHAALAKDAAGVR